MNGSEFPSPLDLTSRRVPVMKGGQQGSPVWNWCNHARHWRTIALPQLPDLGRSHGRARGPKLLPLFISDGGGHSYITDLIRKISQTHTPRDLNPTFGTLWVNKPDDKEQRCWGKAEQSVESLLSVCSFLHLQYIKCNSSSFSFNQKDFVYHHQSSLCCIWRNGPPFTYGVTSSHTVYITKNEKLPAVFGPRLNKLIFLYVFAFVWQLSNNITQAGILLVAECRLKISGRDVTKHK